MYINLREKYWKNIARKARPVLARSLDRDLLRTSSASCIAQVFLHAMVLIFLIALLMAWRTRGGRTCRIRGRRVSTRYRLHSGEGDEAGAHKQSDECSAAMIASVGDRPSFRAFSGGPWRHVRPPRKAAANDVADKRRSEGLPMLGNSPLAYDLELRERVQLNGVV